MGIKRKELAELLGVSVATIRSWESRFDWEDKTPPQKRHDTTEKEYSEADLAAFTIIARGRADNRSLNDIGSTLAAELATFTPDQFPKLPGSEADQPPANEPEQPEQPVAAGGQLITGNEAEQINKLREALANAGGQLKAMEGERERLIDDLDKERAARIEAEKEAANLAGQLAAKADRPAWYRRLFNDVTRLLPVVRSRR